MRIVDLLSSLATPTVSSNRLVLQCVITLFWNNVSKRYLSGDPSFELYYVEKLCENLQPLCLIMKLQFQVDEFIVEAVTLKQLTKVRIGHDNSGPGENFAQFLGFSRWTLTFIQEVDGSWRRWKLGKKENMARQLSRAQGRWSWHQRGSYS